MALLDSHAAFVVHCNKIDGSGWLRNLMSRQGLRTFSDLGFAIGTPQTPATSVEFEAFCTQINSGVDMTISEISRVRRLHFEACTMIVAHQVLGDAGADGVKKLPQAETSQVGSTTGSTYPGCPSQESCSQAMPL